MAAVRKYIKIVLNISIPLLGIWLICWLGPKLLGFFMPFVIGWIVALIANPLVRFLESRVKILPKHSSMLIVVTVLGTIILLLYIFFTRLMIQARGFVNDLPAIYDRMTEGMQLLSVRFSHLFKMLPLDIQVFFNDVSSNVEEYLSILVQGIATPTVEIAGNVAKGIPTVLIYVVVTTLSSYFFIAERNEIMKFWRQHMPGGLQTYGAYMKKDAKHLVGGYFIAQFKIMAVVALILFIGFLILRVRYGFLLAILISFLDFLPLFGTGTALIPWALLEIVSGNYPFAAGLALLYVLTQVIRQMIQPKLVGDTLGLPPLATLLFLYLGFKVSGISGMILAVPIGIFAINLYQYGIFDSLIDNVKILSRDIDDFRKGN